MLILSSTNPTLDSSTEHIAFCIVPNYWKAVRCVGGGHVTPLFEQRVPLFDSTCKKSIDLSMLRLLGLQEMIDNPSPDAWETL